MRGAFVLYLRRENAYVRLNGPFEYPSWVPADYATPMPAWKAYAYVEQIGIPELEVQQVQ